MEYINLTGIVSGLLFCTVLLIVQINKKRETKRLEAEREKSFSMISRCSQLLRLWETNGYMTDTDFYFLQHRIYKDYIRIHELPLKLVSSERIRLILAEGFHLTSALKKDRCVRQGRETNRENTPGLCEVLFNMAVEGFDEFYNHEIVHDDLEWIYYMWLTGAFIQAIYSQQSTDVQELKNLCLKIEKWSANYNIDSHYLKDKIKECRNSISSQADGYFQAC